MNVKSFLKLYTIPVLALFLGFGLYYAVFAGTSDPHRFAIMQTAGGESILPPLSVESVPDFQIRQTPESSGLASAETTQTIPETSFASLDNGISASLNPKSVPEETALVQETIKTYVVLPSALNVRSEPNTLSSVKGKLFRGQKVSVERSASSPPGWARIANGWVLLKFLGETGDAAQATLGVKVSKTEEGGQGSGEYVVIPRSINVRSAPDVSSKSVGKLYAGNVVAVQYVQSGWAKTPQGWVWMNLLKERVGQ